MPTPIYAELDYSPDEDEIDCVIVNRSCLWCKGNSEIRMSKSTYLKWGSRTANIQDIWPLVSIDDRETAITGYHSQCYDEIFADQEESV